MICEGHWYYMNTKEPVGAGHNHEVVNIEEILRHFVHADTGARSLWLFQICSLYTHVRLTISNTGFHVFLF